MSSRQARRVDDAVVHLSDGTPVWIVVRESEDGRSVVGLVVDGRPLHVTNVWNGGDSGNTVEVEIPREERRILPLWQHVRERDLRDAVGEEDR